MIIIGAAVVFFTLNKGEDSEKEQNSNEDETKVDEVESNKYSEYRMSGNSLENFDLQFLQLETDSQNIVYSPLSIKYALAMLSEGATGDSKEQINALIGDYKSNKYTNSANMSFANAMFIKNTFKDSVKEGYATNLQEKFNAEIIYDDFNNADAINSWVNNKTLGLIDKITDDISGNDFYLVNALAIDMEWNKRIQAIASYDEESSGNQYNVNYAHENYRAYISELNGEDSYGTVKFNNGTINSKAVEIGASINKYDIISELGEDSIRATITQEYTKWLEETEYLPNDVEDVATFVDRYIEEISSNYQKVDVSTDFKFYDDETVKVFSKELKEYNGTTLEYIGIMPKNTTLDEYVKNITAKELTETIGKIKSIELDNFEDGKITKITGGIPLFEYEYELNLKADLQSLGITDIFTQGKANLSNIADDSSTYINDAKHKTNIAFSNDGIKAAAVTAMGGLGGVTGGFEYLYDVPVVVIDLNFDNPYLYIIRDKNSGEVWFMGTVYQPTVNSNAYAKVINE